MIMVLLRIENNIKKLIVTQFLITISFHTHTYELHFYVFLVPEYNNAYIIFLLVVL